MKVFVVLFLLINSWAAIALNPSRTYAVRPSDYGLNYEEITIKTSDNVSLKAWLFKPAEVSYKMIILSDDGDGNMADLIEIATNFVSLGYNVLTYDYRGYGESDEFSINPKFYIYSQFEKDLNGAIDYVKKYQSKCRTVNLYGTGLGASLSIAIGAVRCSEISKIIADSPYSTLDDVQKAIKTATGTDVLLPLGFDKNLFEPVYSLEAKGASLNGIFIIYGKNDVVYNDDMVKKIAKIRGSITSTYMVKNADHLTTFSSDKDEYFKQVKAFL
jgi:alpha-beta hydrolase superfamily lysophospholipase